MTELTADHSANGSLSTAQAQAVMNYHAKSFSWAARFLDQSARRDAAWLYAFARLADDLADEEQLGSLPQRLTQLAAMRAEITSKLGGVKGPELQSHARAVGDMLEGYGVDMRIVEVFMDSLAHDAGPRTIATQEELVQFAYGVAGTVGQMMCPILRAPTHAQRYAISLGIAMQLTNIARDVVEDAQRGRCYLPNSWGIRLSEVLAPKNSQEGEYVFSMIERVLTLADDFYAFAAIGMFHIPKKNRAAIDIATALYRGIGQKIRRRGANHYWRGRTSLSRFEKTWIVLNTLLGVRPTYPQEPRDVVGSDLRHLHSIPGFPTSPGEHV